MTVNGKIWGKTELMIRTPLVEVHRLEIIPNAFCSWHRHNFKWNAFICTEGQLFIETRKNDYDLTDTTYLNPGDITTVKPGEVHRFYTLGLTCKAFELYYPESLSEDIIRESVGGVTAENQPWSPPQ